MPSLRATGVKLRAKKVGFPKLVKTQRRQSAEWSRRSRSVGAQGRRTDRLLVRLGKRSRIAIRYLLNDAIIDCGSACHPLPRDLSPKLDPVEVVGGNDSTKGEVVYSVLAKARNPLGREDVTSFDRTNHVLAPQTS